MKLSEIAACLLLLLSRDSSYIAARQASSVEIVVIPPPQVLSAQVSNDLSTIDIFFSGILTIEPAIGVGFPCSPIVQLYANDTGCNGSPCSISCFWRSTDELGISLNSSSEFNLLTPVYVEINSSGILSGIVENAIVQVLPPLNPPVPQVSISGPSAISTCANNSVVLTAYATNFGEF